MDGVEQGYYLLHWGWILQRLGDSQHGLNQRLADSQYGLKLAEKALEIGRSEIRQLKLQALNIHSWDVSADRKATRGNNVA